MLKPIYAFLIIILINSPISAQKHRISVLKGRTTQGSLTKMGEINRWYCLDGIGPIEIPDFTDIQKMSSYSLHNASITYSYAATEKWRLIAGFRYNVRGFGILTTATYPTSGRVDTYRHNAQYDHYGFTVGFENLFVVKNRLNLGWSLLINPEKYLSYWNVSSNMGILVEYRIWHGISLKLNPFAEIGLKKYEKGSDYLDNKSTFHPYGFGYQAGLGFGF